MDGENRRRGQWDRALSHTKAKGKPSLEELPWTLAGRRWRGNAAVMALTYSWFLSFGVEADSIWKLHVLKNAHAHPCMSYRENAGCGISELKPWCPNALSWLRLGFVSHVSYCMSARYVLILYTTYRAYWCQRRKRIPRATSSHFSDLDLLIITHHAHEMDRHTSVRSKLHSPQKIVLTLYTLPYY